MNVDLFYSKAALNGDRTHSAIAKRLDVTTATVINKIEGTSKWTAEEIAKLIFAWNLTPQDVYEIWLKGCVEREGERSREAVECQ